MVIRASKLAWIAFLLLGDGCADSACEGSGECADPTSGAAGSSSGDGGSEAGPASTADEDGADSSTSASTSSASGSTSGSGGETTGRADTSTGGTSTSDSDSSASDEAGTTAGLSELEYEALAIPGGLDRVRVFGHHPTEDWCVWITAVTPSQVSAFPIETTKNWAVESMRISDVGQACGSNSPDMFGAENATAASGTLELYDGSPFPCLVDVDVTAEFEGLLPGVPGNVEMSAIGIPVTGC